MTPMKVLVTGACGLIGHCVYHHLREQVDRYEVYGLDRTRKLSDRVAGDRVFDIPGDQFFEVDLTDMDSVIRAVEGMDIVVHLAADPSSENWESLRDNNLTAAYHVFEASYRAGIRRIVVASSAQVVSGYGEQEPYRAIAEGRVEDVPENYDTIAASLPTEPRNLYAATKVWAESLGRVYTAMGMSCLLVRPGAVNADDKPGRPESGYFWCSQRDIVQLIECCINAGDDVKFGIFHGMSDNRWRWLDIDNARHRVGYIPRDRAEDRI